jgi:uncharacterized protein (DUF1684 family)
MSDTLDLWDYRRRVAEMYHAVREAGPSRLTWAAWTRDRDDLFATHPQSPIEDKAMFAGLPYFPYDPDWRTLGQFTPVNDEATLLESSSAGTGHFFKAGTVGFEVKGHRGTLEVLWLDAYGGGLFLPFRDASNGHATYEGGRYLLDTIKGADLGHDGESIVLDFNYSYHPSCVHSYKWSCPLAPPSNTLGFAVEAGERLLPG